LRSHVPLTLEELEGLKMSCYGGDKVKTTTKSRVIASVNTLSLVKKEEEKRCR